MAMGVVVKQAEDGGWRDLRSIRLKALLSDPAMFGSNRSAPFARE